MWKIWYQRYPLLLPLLGLGTGMLAAASQFWMGRHSLALLSLLLTTPLTLVFFWRRAARPWILTFLFFILGAYRIGDHFFRSPPEPLLSWMLSHESVELWFEAEDYGQSNGRRSSFSAKILGFFKGNELHPAEFQVRLTVGSPECPAVPGGRFRAWVQFREPRNFKNPSSFDYKRYLRAQGLWATAYVRNAESLIPWGGGPPWYFEGASLFRGRLLQVLEKSISQDQARGVLEAMLVGETRALSPDLQEDFRRTGLTHLLVVSGLNFSLTLGILFLPFYFLFSFNRVGTDSGMARRLALGVALAPTCFYAAMVGATPSVLRALGMALILTFAALTRWRRDFFSILILTCFGLLVWRPLLLWDVGFQLSFLSVASVWAFSIQFIKIYDRAAERFLWLKNFALRYFLMLLASSVAVNLALYPLLASIFHEVSLLGPVANLFFVPLFSWVLLPGGMLGAACLGLYAPWAEGVFSVLGRLTEGSLTALRWFAEIPWASVLVPTLSGALLPAYLFFLLGLFQCSRPRRLCSAWAVAFLFLGIHLLSGLHVELAPGLRLTMMDVGQGEALLLRTPSGESFLVDGGGLVFSDFDIGRNILMPELLARGLRRINALILTHPDADHYKGFFFLLKRWEVGEFWLSEATLRHPDFRPLLQILSAKNIPVRLLVGGENFERGGVRWEVLWPPRGDSGLKDNDQSLVLRTCEGEVCFLLTGDIEGETENSLVQSGQELHSSVLKVAHHGSKSSTSELWLEKVQPRLALLSAGTGNRYHFPHPQVLERLEQKEVLVLRTDQEGQLELETDGRNLRYRSFSGRKGVMESPSSRVPSRWSAIRGVFFAKKS